MVCERFLEFKDHIFQYRYPNNEMIVTLQIFLRQVNVYILFTGFKLISFSLYGFLSLFVFFGFCCVFVILLLMLFSFIYLKGREGGNGDILTTNINQQTDSPSMHKHHFSQLILWLVNTLSSVFPLLFIQNQWFLARTEE